jgi:hypothetical protein
VTADRSVPPAADARRRGGPWIVAYADPEPSGIADLLGRLLEANLAARPERAELLRRATIEIRATDANVGVVLELAPGRILVRDAAAATAPDRPGTGPRSDLVIAATSADLLAVAGAPLLGGLPDPRRRPGRDVLAAIAARRIKISGIVRRAGTLGRFARLLSVADDGHR